MFRDVLQQVLFVRKAFVTGVTFERFVGLVTTAVALEVRQLGERFGTTDLRAPVGLVSRMGADMLLQVRQLGEFSLADLAAVRFDP